MTHERRSPRLASLPARRHHETMKALEHLHKHQLQILERLDIIMTANENLAAAVARIEGVGPSIIALLGEVIKELRNIQNNPEAQAMADRLNAQADAIAAAVEANPDPNPND